MLPGADEPSESRGCELDTQEDRADGEDKRRLPVAAFRRSLIVCRDEEEDRGRDHRAERCPPRDARHHAEQQRESGKYRGEQQQPHVRTTRRPGAGDTVTIALDEKRKQVRLDVGSSVHRLKPLARRAEDLEQDEAL